MAFVRTVTKPYFMCLSTDTKLTEGISVGSHALETDTSKEYIFDGTAWVLQDKLATDAEIALIKGELVAIKNSLTDGTQKVETDGNSVSEIAMLPNTEIRNTDSIFTDNIDISSFTSLEIVVISTLNRAVTITPYFDSTDNSYIYYDENTEDWIRMSRTIQGGHAVLPAQSLPYRYLLSGVFPLITAVRAPSLRLQLHCETAPVSGVIRVNLWGVRK